MIARILFLICELLKSSFVSYITNINLASKRKNKELPKIFKLFKSFYCYNVVRLIREN